MTEQMDKISSLDKEILGIKNLHRFSHPAMNTVFEIFIINDSALYAEQAAWAAFAELDHIENDLSRFNPNSDITRINALGRGQPLQIGLSAFECLKTSIKMSAQTKGAFDITIGSLFECLLDEEKKLRRPSRKEIEVARERTGSNLLKLNQSQHTIKVLSEGIKIDLGAIGKGYAADKIAQLLNQWSIDTALISAGQSTILPIGKPLGFPGWPVTMSDPADYSRILYKIFLSGRAISASGLRKGSHIIDPRGGKPVKSTIAAWSTAKTGAQADALSTAFMVMSANEVRAYCVTHKETNAFLVMPGKNKREDIIKKFGRWDRLFLGLEH
jgi:FAD:protein FMN transferase